MTGCNVKIDYQGLAEEQSRTLKTLTLQVQRLQSEALHLRLAYEALLLGKDSDAKELYDMARRSRLMLPGAP